MASKVKRVRMKKDGTPWLPNKEFKALQKEKLVIPPITTKVVNQKKKGVGQQTKKKKARIKKVVPPLAANAQTVINIPADFQLDAVQLMWLSTWTRMFEKAWNSNPPPYGTEYILDAFQIMQTVTSQIMAGATPNIIQLPAYVQIMLNLLAPKNVAFRLNSIKYSWSMPWTATNTAIIPVSPAGVALHWVFGDPDVVTSVTYAALIIPFSAILNSDETNLQIAFGLIEDLSPDTKLQPTGQVKLGKNDASAFARTFEYLGQGNSTAGGAYGECEQEVSFVKSWIPAQFVTFLDTDTRVSRSYRPKSGDSCLCSGLALMAGMRASDFKNGPPIIYKFIDFEEIYYEYIQWLSLAWTNYLQSPVNESQINLNMTTSLPFTVQDFRIILRQALLQCFSNQAIVQFMCPKPQNGVNDNVFVPFIMHAGTYSASEFGSMKFPLILGENMKMLKTAIVEVNGPKSKVVHVPVLGKWINDTYVPDPQLVEPQEFVEAGGLTPFSMFMDPTGQNVISLYDGKMGASSYVNFNGLYYQTALTYLNALVSQLSNTGGMLTTITGDSGPGLSLLNFTRYIAVMPPGMVAKRQRRYECLLEAQERVKELKRAKSKGKLLPPVNADNMRGVPVRQTKDDDSFKVNPIGDVYTNYTVAISATVQLTQPMQSLLQSFIIPNIRPDTTDTLQPQSYSEWQIASIEPNLATYQTGGNAIASTVRADDLSTAAAAPITNILNGENSSDLMKVFQKLVEEGCGPDWMGILTSGLGFGLQVAKAFL